MFVQLAWARHFSQYCWDYWNLNEQLVNKLNWMLMAQPHWQDDTGISTEIASWRLMTACSAANFVQIANNGLLEVCVKLIPLFLRVIQETLLTSSNAIFCDRSSPNLLEQFTSVREIATFIRDLTRKIRWLLY